MKTDLLRHTPTVSLLGLALLARGTDFYVSLTGWHVPPFTNWPNAATNIQDAIDVASVGDTVWVTNGVYATGGKVMGGDLTNRVAVDKALSLKSMNGPDMTIIQGMWDPVTTNGPLAIRSVWLGSNAVLKGFTIRDGATRTNGDVNTVQGGGGVWCEASESVVENCIISNNAAFCYGGGVAGGRVQNSRLIMNQVGPYFNASGGGANGSALINSYVVSNYSTYYGGGLSGGYAANCTLVQNHAKLGGGTAFTIATNSIVYFNSNSGAGPSSANYYSAGLVRPFIKCCTVPFRGTIGDSGNFTSDPQMLDAYHIAAASPCRGVGVNLATGTDLDGEPWGSPPSVGCDEVVEANLTGPLELTINTSPSLIAERGLATLTGTLSGRASRVGWDYGDGSILTNQSVFLTSHIWTNAGHYNVSFTAWNADYPDGVSTNLMLQVVPLVSPQIENPTVGSNSFTLSFQGQPGIRYYIEQATNLVPPVVWTTVQSPRSTGQVMQVADTSATNDMRFYRVRIP